MPFVRILLRFRGNRGKRYGAGIKGHENKPEYPHRGKRRDQFCRFLPALQDTVMRKSVYHGQPDDYGRSYYH